MTFRAGLKKFRGVTENSSVKTLKLSKRGFEARVLKQNYWKHRLQNPSPTYLIGIVKAVIHKSCNKRRLPH